MRFGALTVIIAGTVAAVPVADAARKQRPPATLADLAQRSVPVDTSVPVTADAAQAANEIGLQHGLSSTQTSQPVDCHDPPLRCSRQATE